MAVAQTAQSGTSTNEFTGACGTAAGAQKTAESAALRGLISINVAGRRLELLPPEQIGFLAGVGLIAALGIIEWPVAVVVAVGHTIAYRAQRAGVRNIGAALEKA
jgi:hypothetical protein